ncbi:rab3 GTPase-activating protein catalytic subunit isoform X2 [Dendrobium catenatum]|uniref:rab3 GTPase-activating protein catalytic subunit isoform X2 n=1 Tax=Dendrobium catenatum TaxID=906689 RepID=UPI0009F2BB4C|nr:rab3 GTPase-activating protein catalytic subunit isoform X2 [Dendrobium catenatum]
MESASYTAVDTATVVGGASFPALSFVSRAKTALHSAAARAEKVLTEIKADLKNDRDADGQGKKDFRKMEDQESAVNDGFSKPREEIPEACSAAEHYVNNFCNKLTIPPASVLKQLAAAYETGKNFICSKNLLNLVEDPLPAKEKSGLSFSSVKSLVLREKDDKSFSNFYDDDELHFKMQLLFDSEVIGGFKSIQKMASFWGCVVIKLRKLWSEGLPVPRMPLDANPDLDSCLLHQQLQVINCCISRKVRRNAAIELLDSVIKEASSDNNDLVDSPKYSNCMRYARLISGEYVLRLGVDHLSENLTMLETGEPICSPVTQEGPILTEELIKETEELVLRTGSFGVGCSQLLSDMQAFKAANPGCALEDFIRWHSPPDWTEIDSISEANVSVDGEGSSRRGRLSKRMLKEGNLWQELWKSAKALPAVQQTPVFDEDLAVESIFTTLEDIRPSELFGQLFMSMLCSAFTIAEASISPDSNVSKIFFDCKDWVITTCQNGISSDNIGDICKVYETVETIVNHPEEAITIMDQAEETVNEEPKNRFKRINLNFMKKERNLLRKKPSKEEKNSDEKQMHVFSQLFDKKSLFSKKQTKLKRASNSEPTLEVNDWTIV